jgi:hypothetical protein
MKIVGHSLMTNRKISSRAITKTTKKFQKFLGIFLYLTVINKRKFFDVKDVKFY